MAALDTAPPVAGLLDAAVIDRAQMIDMAFSCGRACEMPASHA
jgi:hypothetical protein